MGWRWRRKNISRLLQHTRRCKSYCAWFVLLTNLCLVVEATISQLLNISFLRKSLNLLYRSELLDDKNC
jgi:hypothetical protein